MNILNKLFGSNEPKTTQYIKEDSIKMREMIEMREKILETFYIIHDNLLREELEKQIRQGNYKEDIRIKKEAIHEHLFIEKIKKEFVGKELELALEFYRRMWLPCVGWFVEEITEKKILELLKDNKDLLTKYKLMYKNKEDEYQSLSIAYYKTQLGLK